MSQTPDTQTPDTRTLQQKHRPYNLRVTDLRDQAWCEQQLAFGLVDGREETEVMRAGSERHQALHEEIAEIITVRPKTREDMWGIHMWNALAGMQLLKHTGLGREIPVFGIFQDTWIVGIIDQLQAHPEHDHIELLDTKTRRSPSMPRIEQKRASRYQLAIYKYLFDQMTQPDFPTQDFLSDFRLNPTTPFSEEVLQELNAHELPFTCLEELLPITLHTFSDARPLSNRLSIRYEWQQDQTPLGTDSFNYTRELVEQRLSYHLPFWRNERPPTGVGPKETWKCRYCEFQNQCSFFR